MLGVSTRFARAAGLSWVALRALLEIERFPARVFFAPPGLGELFRELTQGLRPGLHSFAALRLAGARSAVPTGRRFIFGAGSRR
jgi:hypothetical protein